MKLLNIETDLLGLGLDLDTSNDTDDGASTTDPETDSGATTDEVI